jgi:hypothetical protein
MKIYSLLTKFLVCSSLLACWTVSAADEHGQTASTNEDHEDDEARILKVIAEMEAVQARGRALEARMTKFIDLKTDTSLNICNQWQGAGLDSKEIDMYLRVGLRDTREMAKGNIARMSSPLKDYKKILGTLQARKKQKQKEETN